MLCYRTGGKTGGVDLEEKTEGWRAAVSLPASLEDFRVVYFCLEGVFCYFM